MADQNKNGESVGAEEQVVKFNKEDALNKKEFIDFLSRFEDVKEGDVSDEQIKERFEVFEIKNKVAEDIKKVYGNEIFSEMGVRLAPDDTKSVDTYVEKIAIDNPGELLQMAKSIEQYKEYPTKIAEAQSKLKEYEDSFLQKNNKISDEKMIAQQALKGLGPKEKISMYAGLIINKFDKDFGKSAVAMASVQEKLRNLGVPVTSEGIAKKFSDLGIEGDKLKEEAAKEIKDKVIEISELISGFTNLKDTMFANLSIHNEIIKIAKDKLKQQITVLGKGGISTNIDKALGRVEKVKDNVVLGSEVMTDQENEQIEMELNDNAENYVLDNVNKILGNIKFKSKPFSELENELKDITSLEKIGTNDPVKTQEYIVASMQLFMGGLSNSAEDIAKKILIKQLIIKIEASKNK